MAQAKNSVFLCFHILCFFILSSFSHVSSQNKPNFACDIASNPNLRYQPFCNKALPIKIRVAYLVRSLTLQEKIGWLGDGSTGIPRLGIPNYEWWSEILHGVSSTGPGTHFSNLVPGATSFPQVILTGATFNLSLFHMIGKVASTEARAMHNVGLAGLTFWSPNINILRDPRWGRAQETPGEDPLLTSKYAVAFVKGLQERDDGNRERLKVGACCKHYTAYDVDNWKGYVRHTFNAVVNLQDMIDTFQPPFKSCVIEGNVASVMCSYNQVNGKPTCGNPDLLVRVIRGMWRLNGYISSDCDSLQDMFYAQHYTQTPEETAALALNSGLDLDCGVFLANFTQQAVDRGLLKEIAIDRAVTNNFATLMRLGFFDGDPSTQIYGNLGPQDVCSPENQELARETARQGIVLLKNTKNSLPLNPANIKSLAVIGPNANATDVMIGNYAGTPCGYITPLQGLNTSVPVRYLASCTNVTCEAPDIAGARNISATADAVVLVMGSDQTIEAEAKDRINITLPGQQNFLVSEVANASKGPVILVIMSGGCMDVQFAKDDPKVTSILWVGLPGQAGGAAIADVIFGLHNPSGRLPVTWYPQSYVEQVNMTNMNFRPDPSTGFPGRTYRFYTGPTVYSFGDGLSYSTFTHHLIQAPRHVLIPLEEKHVCRTSRCKSIEAWDSMCKGLDFDVHLRVKNEGEMRGSHTVLFFSSPPRVHNAPVKHLVAFEKIHLTPMEEGLVRFNLDVCKHLSVVDKQGISKIALGEYVLHIGSLRHYLNVTFD